MLLRLSMVAALVSLLVAPGAWAQKAEPVRFKTVDGVNIHGSYYSTNRRNAPAVLILHALGEDSSKKGLTTLAEELASEGFAVLAFDFRGHGRSTSIQAGEFWYGAAAPRNTLNTAQYLKGQVGRDTIEFKEFNPSYYPVLINDIAAARGFLDRKNDTGACNTSSLVVIGAEEGGTLGAAWINSECRRYRFHPAAVGFPIQPAKLEKDSEGDGIVCGIWLSLSPKLGNRDISIPQTLHLPAKTKGIPMVFMHGDDELDTKFAKYCEKNLVVYEEGKEGKQKADSYKFTLTVPVRGKVKGAGLIDETMAKALAAKYLKSVVLEKGKEWQQKDYRDAQYYWVFGPTPAQWVPAKVIMREDNLVYSTYSQFIIGR